MDLHNSKWKPSQENQGRTLIKENPASPSVCHAVLYLGWKPSLVGWPAAGIGDGTARHVQGLCHSRVAFESQEIQQVKEMAGTDLDKQISKPEGTFVILYSDIGHPRMNSCLKESLPYCSITP